MLELGINIGEVERRYLIIQEQQKSSLTHLTNLLSNRSGLRSYLTFTGRALTINKKVKGNDDIVATLQTKYENLSNLLSVAVSGAFVEVAKNTSLATDSLNENYKSWEDTGKSIGRF